MQRPSNPSNIKIQMNNFTLNLQTLLSKNDDKLPTTYRKNTKTQRNKTYHDDTSPIKIKKKTKQNHIQPNKQISKKQDIPEEFIKQHSKTNKLINHQKKDKKQLQTNIKKVKKIEHLNTQQRSKSRNQKSTRLQRHFTDYDHVIQSARLRTSPSINFFNQNFNSQSISKSPSRSRSKSFKKKQSLSNNQIKSRLKSIFSTNINQKSTTKKQTQKMKVKNKKKKQELHQLSKSGQKLKKVKKLSKSKQQQKSIDYSNKIMNKSKSRERIYTQVSEKHPLDQQQKHLYSNYFNPIEYSQDRTSLSHKKTKLQHCRQQSENLMSHSSENGIILGPKFASNKINSKQKIKSKSIDKIKTKKVSNTISATNSHKPSKIKKIQSTKMQVSFKTEHKQKNQIKQKISTSSQCNFYQSTTTNIEKRKLTQSDLNNYFKNSAKKKIKKLKTSENVNDQNYNFVSYGLSLMKKEKKQNTQQLMLKAFKKKNNKNAVQELFEEDNNQQVRKTKRNLKKLGENYNQQKAQQKDLKYQIPLHGKRQKKLTIETTFRHDEKEEIFFDDISKILQKKRKTEQSMSGQSRHSLCRSEKSIKQEIMEEHERVKGIKRMEEDVEEIRRLRTQQLQDSQEQEEQDEDNGEGKSDNGQDDNDGEQSQQEKYQSDNDEQQELIKISSKVEIFTNSQIGKSQQHQIEQSLSNQNQQLSLNNLNSSQQQLNQKLQNKTLQHTKLFHQSYGDQNKNKIISSLNKPRKSVDEQFKIAKTLSNKKLLQQLELQQTLQKIQKSLQNSFINQTTQYHLLSTSRHHSSDKDLINQHINYQIQHQNLHQHIYQHLKQTEHYQAQQQKSKNINYLQNYETININKRHKTINQLQQQLLLSIKFNDHENNVSNNNLSVNIGNVEMQRQDSPLLSDNQFKRSSPINLFDSMDYHSLMNNDLLMKEQLVPMKEHSHPITQEELVRVKPFMHLQQLQNQQQLSKESKRQQQAYRLYNNNQQNSQLQLCSQFQENNKKENSSEGRRGEYSQLSLQFQKQMDDYLKDNSQKSLIIPPLKPNHINCINNNINKYSATLSSVSSINSKQETNNANYDSEKSSDSFFYYLQKTNDQNQYHTLSGQSNSKHLNSMQHQSTSHSQLIQTQITQHILKQLLKQFTILLAQKQTLLHKFLQYASQLNIQPLSQSNNQQTHPSNNQQTHFNQQSKKKPIFDPFQALDNNQNQQHIINNTNHRQVNQDQFLNYLQSKIYANNDYILNLAYQLFNFVKTSPDNQQTFLSNIKKSFGLKPLKTLKWMRKAYTQNDQQQAGEQQQQQNKSIMHQSKDKNGNCSQDESLSDLSQNQQLQAVFSPILLADFDAQQNQIIFQQINQEQYYLNHAVYAALNEISDSHRPYGENGPPVIPKNKPVLNISFAQLQPKILSRLERILQLRMGRTQFLPDQQPERIIPESYKKMDEMIVEEEHDKWNERNLQDLIFESKYYLAMPVVETIINQEVMEIFRLLYN